MSCRNVSPSVIRVADGIIFNCRRNVLERSSDMVAKGRPESEIVDHSRRFIRNRVVSCPSLEQVIFHAGESNAPDNTPQVLVHIKSGRLVDQDDGNDDAQVVEGEAQATLCFRLAVN
jgi:hypothetical protein